MGPKRKKSKSSKVDDTEGSMPSTVQTNGHPGETPPNPATNPTSTPSRSSWYGSWRSSSKSLPATAQIARESISVAKGATSSTSESHAARPPASVSKSIRGGSRKSVPQAAEVTKVHATSDASDQSRPRFTSSGEKLKATEEPAEVVVEEARLPPEPESVAQEGAGDPTKAQPSTWFAWWSRPDGYGSDNENRQSKRQKMDGDGATSTPLPSSPIAQPADDGSKTARDFEGISAPTGNSQPADMPGMVAKDAQPAARGWFGLWSSAQNQPQPGSEQASEIPQEIPPPPAISVDPPCVETTTAQAEDVSTTPAKEAQIPTKSSGWAFWSSEKAKDPSPTPGGTQKQIGELAVADTPSQSHPEAAQFNAQQGSSKTVPQKKDTSSLLQPKRNNPAKESSTSESSSPLPTPRGQSPTVQTPATEQQPSRPATPPPHVEASSILSRIPDPQKPPSKQSASATKDRPNLTLPEFHPTFSPTPSPGYVERLTQYLAQTLNLPGSESPPAPIHVYKSSSLPKIKRAVALGVHGFFPAPMIQKLIGQPKGTSIRFANHAATAIKKWCEDQQPDVKNVEIEKVALEGEGYIADRVTTLWKLLLNWLSHLRQADFILVACHSQGVPVAVMLVSKLIQLGCLAPNVRIGICAMAGVNLGPFIEYRSRLFGPTALELFDFNDPKSSVSRTYAESLMLCLRHGVRVTFVGSLDDQLVSLESSLYTPLHHPYVMRAIFIDGRIHASNFLTHLVVFAAKLRNLGVSDHGLIRELSAPLAGSLVGGEGHSRIYDELNVYRTAVLFALESTDVQARPPPSNKSPSQSKPDSTRRNSLRDSSLPTSPALATHLRQSSLTSATLINVNPTRTVQPILQTYEPPAPSGTANPFYLPWAVRGMLEEDLVKKDESLREEVAVLVEEFESWRPTTKAMKDVRWRLEGVRNMV